MTIKFQESQKHSKLFSYSDKDQSHEGDQKMEFEEINPNTWKPEKEGDSVEGVFIAQRDDIGPNKSKTYYLEKDGDQMMVWGSTVIDDRMTTVKIGEYVRITFKGTAPNKKGQDTKIYKIERAKQ